MSDRVRARVSVLLIRAARRLLRLRPATDREGPCVYCGERVCQGADHAEDCPSSTGVFPVRLEEMWPAGPARCDHCGTLLWPGDTYSHIDRGEGNPMGVGPDLPIYEVACTGCALLAEIEAS